jgi:general secretion pathway protein G
MKQCNNVTIKQLNNKIISFTLIEILVVATIISLLAAGGLVSYSTLTKNSLDARRKADLEQIRAALEMYRSNVGSYPADTPSLPSPLQEGSNVYLQSVPTDPKTKSSYTYTPSPGGCNGTTTLCTNYTLSATLENGDVYTATPYGSQTVTATPEPPTPTP